MTATQHIPPLSLEPGRSDAAAQVTVVRPPRGFKSLELVKLWRYRDLLWFMALRDIKVRYKQTVLGVLWAVLQPLVTMIVLSIFFGRMAGMGEKTGGIAYPIFLYAGLLPWTFFAETVNASSNSLISNAHILRKVYFPRLIMPLASAGVPALNYVVAFGVLLGMMAWYQVQLSWQLLLLPALLATTILTAMGVGILLTALTVAYRDFRYVVAFLVQIWFFVTPVIWPQTIVPERFHWLLMLNPMHGTIEAFRAVVLGTPLDYVAWAISTAVASVCAVAGVLYFNRTEQWFADIV